jgi:hypothetical protein
MLPILIKKRSKMYKNCNIRRRNMKKTLDEILEEFWGPKRWEKISRKNENQNDSCLFLDELNLFQNEQMENNIEVIRL